MLPVHAEYVHWYILLLSVSLSIRFRTDLATRSGLYWNSGKIFRLSLRWLVVAGLWIYIRVIYKIERNTCATENDIFASFKI